MPNRDVMLIGTHETVADLICQMRALGLSDPIGCVLVGSAKVGDVAGLPVIGHEHDLERVTHEFGIGRAVLCLPADDGPAAHELGELLDSFGVTCTIMPSVRCVLGHEPVDRPIRSFPALRTGSKLDLGELIGREPYGIDRRAVAEVLTDKRVLVTGAGGSIGSELARIAATFGPELLILMERSENALFEIDRQLGSKFPDVPRRAILHDVVDEVGTRRHIGDLRPHAVFHAAAHKHVPLMEDHACQAVTNNLFGTKAVADAAVESGAERFVMISTDKAVNPVSVMGATKRLAELYVQHLERAHTGTRCCMVRFGNVLGSAGSVLPIWSSQLDEGGPITVTDARMTRYFMTIPEAASLVIQAGAIDDHTADVFVLDMGEPVRILDLADRFVRLHGFTPRVLSRADAESHTLGGWLGAPGPVMDIVLSGARPGEKLYEELAYAAEQLRPTGCPGINAWSASTAPSAETIAAMIAEMHEVRAEPDANTVLRAIRRHLPEMRRATAQVESREAGRPAAA